jgi:carbon-monoxide dehydrogenase small subunit
MSQDTHIQARSADTLSIGGQAHGHTRSGTTVAFTLNGKARQVVVPPMRRLLDVLREELGLTGTKEGCGEGECGACSVLIEGQPVNSCLVPAIQAQGANIVTIEGLAHHAVLHPVQQAFLDHGGAQCGICTPGMVVTAAWMVDQGLPAEEVPQRLAGNLCRCTGYGQIVEAVQAAVRGSQKT